jgi:protein-L-isoaspartate(D-aspartate) O-methyltransferase
VSDHDTPADRRRVLVGDTELAAIARDARRDTIQRRLANEPFQAALLEVPRERFVREDDLPLASDDRALPLDDHATISAMHAYTTSFAALELTEGDQLVELGGGSGYGAAIAASIVGATGRVRTLEIDETLASLARELLAPYANVTALAADAHDVEQWRGARKVSVAFAVEHIPREWLDALAPGGALVAPVGGPQGQTLIRVDKSEHGVVSERALSRVLYVRDRSQVALSGAAE